MRTEGRNAIGSNDGPKAIIVAFRRHTLLPLDDCLYALQPTLPHLTRSSLHRCFQRQDISRLPDIAGDKPAKAFKACPIGYFDVDIAEVQTAEGKLYFFVGIDHTSKFAYFELHLETEKIAPADFLCYLITAVPYSINIVLTERAIGSSPMASDIPFTNQKHHTSEFTHIFDRVCHEHQIDHWMTKVRHPWTNGQVERMNRKGQGGHRETLSL